MLKGFAHKHAYYTADSGAGTGGGESSQQAATGAQQGGETPAGDEAPPTFEAWFETLGDDHKDLIATHTSGLKKALQAERERASAFEKQLKGLSKHVEAGSEAAKSLEKLQADLAAANRRASFYQGAGPAEVATDALELAYMAAESGGFIGAENEIDWKALRTAHPRLFVTAETPKPPSAARVNAGAGAGQRTEPVKSGNERVNDALRAALRGRG